MNDHDTMFKPLQYYSIGGISISLIWDVYRMNIGKEGIILKLWV